MLFNSIPFCFFLLTVFFCYWFVFNKSLKVQNIFLLLTSYFFYSCWDWRFLFLLAFSTFLDYFTGLRIHNAPDKKMRQLWLVISVGVNLGFLGVFKYYNFFAESFTDLLHWFGLNASYTAIKVILPVGISFYTFHGLSYVFDINKKKIEPTKDFVQYALFVSFFPLLVAGPIERATHLLPQVEKNRTFSYTKAIDGLRQMLWGVLKKVVIADNCGHYASQIFNNYDSYSGITLALGAVLFAFQIYGDFSGYSDMALGMARLFGFELLKNFAFPYFSRDIAEFWRRWHISLSSWFRDYLYFPLGGSRGGNWQRIRNTFIIFLVSGFWHGANWTFIVWGGLNAIFIMPSILFKTNRNNLDIVAQGKTFPSVRELFSMILTFALTVFAWIFFRADNLTVAFDYVRKLITGNWLSGVAIALPKFLWVLIPLFVFIEWLGREGNYAIEKLDLAIAWPLRWLFYFFLLVLAFMFMGEAQQFIYFQF